MGLLQMIKNRNEVLGLNARYLDYIRPNNLKGAFQIADDKILTKKILNKAGVPTPELLGVISNVRELREFDFDTLPKSFVLKPVFGSEGRGIDIFYNKKNDVWIKASGERVNLENLKSRVREILEGRYSMFNQPDIALFEERVKPHKIFRYYTYKGTPDVRVIMYNGIPIMGMLRLPTEESDGKANLKLKGIGGAIDIAAGRVMTAVKGKSQIIEYVPHTKQRISGLRIPYWEKMLKHAATAQRATGLGYGCFDFLIDRDKGPLLVEIGARPGLSIQLADQEGQRSRLRRVKGVKVKSLNHGIRLGKNMFGGEIEENVENLTGKPVIGLIEKVKLEGKDGKTVETFAKIDTGATRTSLDSGLATELGFAEAIEYANKILLELPEGIKSNKEAKELSEQLKLNERLEEYEDIVGTSIVAASNGVSYRIRVPMALEIKGQKVNTNVTFADRKNLNYKMIIGKKDLYKFLIDPSK